MWTMLLEKFYPMDNRLIIWCQQLVWYIEFSSHGERKGMAKFLILSNTFSIFFLIVLAIFAVATISGIVVAIPFVAPPAILLWKETKLLFASLEQKEPSGKNSQQEFMKKREHRIMIILYSLLAFLLFGASTFNVLDETWSTLIAAVFIDITIGTSLILLLASKYFLCTVSLPSAERDLMLAKNM